MLLKGIIQGHAVYSAVLGPHIFTIHQHFVEVTCSQQYQEYNILSCFFLAMKDEQLLLISKNEARLSYQL